MKHDETSGTHQSGAHDAGAAADTDAALRRLFTRNAPSVDGATFLREMRTKSAAQSARRRRGRRRLIRPATVTVIILSALAIAGVGVFELRQWIVSDYLIQFTDAPSVEPTTVTSVPTGTSATGVIPAPDYAALVPFGYVIDKTLDLQAGGPADDHVVVSSDGLAGNSLKPVSVRIVSWDAAAGAWVVALDLAKVQVETPVGDRMPLMPTECSLLAIEPAWFTGRAGPALVMAVDVPGADSQSLVAVISHEDGAWRIAYSHLAAGTVAVAVEGVAPNQTLGVEAGFYGPLDAHSEPPRTYRFVIGGTASSIAVIADDRPWLGVSGVPDWIMMIDSSTRWFDFLKTAPKESFFLVQAVMPGSPADGALQPGDVLVGATTGPEGAMTDLTRFIEERFHAGDQIRLGVWRDGALNRTVTVTLGSVLDPPAVEAGATSWYVFAQDR